MSFDGKGRTFAKVRLILQKKISLEGLAGITDSIDAAITACKAAGVQIRVDNDFRLRAPVDQIVASLELARTFAVTGFWNGDAERMIYDRFAEFTQLAADAISGVNFD